MLTCFPTFSLDPNSQNPFSIGQGMLVPCNGIRRQPRHQAKPDYFDEAICVMGLMRALRRKLYCSSTTARTSRVTGATSLSLRLSGAILFHPPRCAAPTFRAAAASQPGAIPHTSAKTSRAAGKQKAPPA